MFVSMIMAFENILSNFLLATVFACLLLQPLQSVARDGLQHHDDCNDNICVDCVAFTTDIHVPLEPLSVAPVVFPSLYACQLRSDHVWVWSCGPELIRAPPKAS